MMRAVKLTAFLSLLLGLVSPLAGQDRQMSYSFETVRDEYIALFVELAKQLPTALPSDFPISNETYEYHHFTLDEAERSKTTRAPLVQSQLLSPLPVLPDAVKQQLAESPIEKGIDQQERDRRIAQQQKIFADYFEAPAVSSFQHQHWIGLVTGRKIGVTVYTRTAKEESETTESQEVWDYPVGTRLMHLMTLQPPVLSFKVGDPEKQQELFSSYPKDMVVPFELRLLQKTASGMWAVGVYRPQEIKPVTAPPKWRWVRHADLDSDNPQHSFWGKAGQTLPNYTIVFGANDRTTPPLAERSIAGELHSANPLSCLSCHVSSSRSQQQLPGLHLVDQNDQPVAVDEKVARIFVLPYAAPNSFAPANSAIRNDAQLRGLFEEEDEKSMPMTWPKGTYLFKRRFVPYVIKKTLD